MSKPRTGLLIASCLSLALFLAGCGTILTLEPPTAVNPTGTEHTVTGTVEEFDLSDICEVIPSLPFCLPAAAAPGENVFFEVIDGPNDGKQSDGDCGPDQDDLCFVTPPDSISWTYRGTGGPGTDTIQFCLMMAPTIEESKAVMSNAITTFASQMGMTEAEVVDMLEPEDSVSAAAEVDPGCVGVTKTWEAPTPTPTATPQVIEDDARPSRPNIGAGLSGLFAGQPTALPTAVGPASAPLTPSQTIRPPSTGDAGLR